jgi:EF hand domain-containing protein
MKLSPYALAAVLMMGVTLAAAQTPGGTPPSQASGAPAPNPEANKPAALAAELFKALDTNRDGFISREEAKGSTAEGIFDALDKDRDGRLSKDEYAAGIAGASAGGTAGTSSGRASMPK